ncbi:MAG: ABC transporter permease, partial [Actinomycetota bacterium]
MGIGDAIRMALRNIRRQKTRSFLTIFAIVIGSLAVTIMLALTLNATSYVRAAAERTGLSTRVFVTGEKGVDYYSAGQGFSRSTNKLTQSSIQTVSVVPHVAAVAGLASTPFQRLRFNGVEVRDMHSVAVQPTGAIAHSMLAGRDLTPEATGEVVLVSSKLAQLIGFDAGSYDDLVGQRVTLVTDQWFRGPGADQTTCSPDNGCGPTPLEATVLGVYEGDAEVSVAYDWAYALATETFQEG